MDKNQKKNFTDWGRPGNKWHQIHCGNDTELDGATDYIDDENEATGSETGSQIRKRRQMEIDITQPQIIPQPEKPKLTNRKVQNHASFHAMSHQYDSSRTPW